MDEERTEQGQDDLEPTGQEQVGVVPIPRVAAAAVAPPLVGAEEQAALEAPPKRRNKKRRSWARWLANLMIIGGVLVLVYPLATWGYTWFEQRGLERELREQSPEIFGDWGGLGSEGFVEIRTTVTVPKEEPSAPGTESEETPEEAAARAAEEERLAKLAEFEAAATAFHARMSRKYREPLGRIIIPSIGVDVIMIEGTDTSDLREAPGHWPETPFPGQGGNFVVSGHRTTYGAPFRKFDKVLEGDLIEVVLPYAVVRYTVSRVIIVEPHQVEEVAQLGREQMSMAACHPLFSARQRIVVQGELDSFKLLETGP